MDQIKEYLSKAAEALQEKKPMAVGVPVAALLVGGILPTWGAMLAVLVALAIITLERK